MKQPTAHNWISQNARREVGFIVLLSVMTGLSSGAAVAFALLTRRVIDIATADSTGDIAVYIGLLIGTLLVQIALDMTFNYLSTWVSGHMQMRVKNRVFSVLFHKQWQDVSRFHSGELHNRLHADVQVVANGVIGFVPRVVSLVTRLVACLVVLFVLDAWFTGIMLGIGLVLLLGSRAYGRRMKNLHKVCQESDGVARSYVQEGLENWTTIQAFEGSDYVRGRLDERLKAHFGSVLRRNRWSVAANGVLHLLFSGSYYAALAWGALRLASGAISYGTLMAFMQIVGQIRTPFMRASGILPQYYSMLASAERLIELESLPDEPCMSSTVDWKHTAVQSIRMTDVFFAYDAENSVLTGASLTVKRGDFVALVGFSGIGKSTLFRLMLGFCMPQSGGLTISTEQGTVSLDASTRGAFAYVPQQGAVLSGTIRENITFCCPNATDEMIWQAAETAAVADVIRRLPNGLDTVLGERGAGLSEGQIQRLAIARAVLYDAPVLLLDEVTASLDEMTEQQVLRNLRDLPGKTCLCISHRPAALSVCDRVIRMEKGQFVEE